MKDEVLSRRLKLRQSNVLLSVIQWGSMARAADHLSVSQPVVSKTIADLEALLGVSLLDRISQGVEPTAYGRALARRSIALFNDLRTSISELEALADPSAGELRIGTTEPMAAGLVSKIIGELLQNHPRVMLHVILGDPPSLRERELRDREIDLVIGRLPNDIADDHTQLEVLFWERAFVVAGAEHELTSRRKIKLEDLMNEAWCLPPPQSFPGSLIGRAFQAAGLEVPRTCVSAHSIQMQNALLATGRFLTILPETMMHLSAKRLGLKSLPVHLPIEPTPVAVVTLRNRELPPVGKLFIERARTVAESLVRQSRPPSDLAPKSRPVLRRSQRAARPPSF
jgi:DNA-binding transcriptional LysR family regulator